ncbi:MAG: Fic family protein [Bacteroidetes bacterium]|nr:Fic family protein [Bacteroidota bacterium]
MTFQQNIGKINILKDEWDKLQPISKENNNILWRKFRLEWNYNSNHIEGNTLTYGETELLLIFDKTTGDHEKREYDEMQAHDAAIHLIKEWASDNTRDITETDIRSLNKLILVKPFWKEAITYDGQPTRRLIKVGEYKEHPNSVRLKTGEIFDFASPEETPRLMKELMDWYKKNINEHPVILASEMHYRFIRIHPFDDGNGRIARLIVNYILMKNDYPPVIVKSIEKEKYFTALQKADAGDIEGFHNYMANQLIWSFEIAIKAAKGESIEEPGDLDKKVELLKRNLKTKNKIVYKDKKVVETIINNIYCNFLSALGVEMKRFDALFKSGEWYYCKGATVALSTIDNNHFASEKLDNIIKLLIGFAKNGSESKYEIRLFFKRFNDEDDSFDVAIVHDIQFSERQYKIKRFIGMPEESSRFMRAINSLNLVLNKDGKINIKFSEQIISEKRYNEIVTENEIQSWAKKTADALFDYIEKEAQELDRRREKK